MQTEITAILSHGEFQMSKWHSKCHELRNDDSIKSLSPEPNNIMTTSGVNWDHITHKFTFIFKFKFPYAGTTTK